MKSIETKLFELSHKRCIVDGRTDGQTDGQTDVQTDGQTDMAQTPGNVAKHMEKNFAPVRKVLLYRTDGQRHTIIRPVFQTGV